MTSTITKYFKEYLMRGFNSPEVAAVAMCVVALTGCSGEREAAAERDYVTYSAEAKRLGAEVLQFFETNDPGAVCESIESFDGDRTDAECQTSVLVADGDGSHSEMIATISYNSRPDATEGGSTNDVVARLNHIGIPAGINPAPTERIKDMIFNGQIQYGLSTEFSVEQQNSVSEKLSRNEPVTIQDFQPLFAKFTPKNYIANQYIFSTTERYAVNLDDGKATYYLTYKDLLGSENERDEEFITSMKDKISFVHDDVITPHLTPLLTSTK